jgi:hypothetical protein
MRRLKRMAAVVLAGAGLGAGLGACTSDPAFWAAVAEGLDQAAYDLANEPVCSWYTDRYGVVRQYCQPAYLANSPVYVPPHDGYRDRPDRRDRHDRDGRRHRDGRRDRDGRKG